MKYQETKGDEMRYIKKPVAVEAITFDELVACGVAVGATCHNGMPRSFNYMGHPITHEDDNTYLIPAPGLPVPFRRGDMLVTSAKGEIRPFEADIFAATFEPWRCPTCDLTSDKCECAPRVPTPGCNQQHTEKP